MSIKLTSHCQPTDEENDQPVECRATFSVDGQCGNQTFESGGIFTLLADDKQADTYQWAVIGTPPNCDYQLVGATQPQAKVSLLGVGAFSIELTVTKGNCRAQARYILWVATPCRLYRLPATTEALRFDGKEEWAGDLGRVIKDVDCNLPTPKQKAALDHANNPNADNPLATLDDLPHWEIVAGLTKNETAAIKNSRSPSADNIFVTNNHLHEVVPTPEQKAALAGFNEEYPPSEDNPFATQKDLPTEPGDEFVTRSEWEATAPTLPQKSALVGFNAEYPPGEDNPFATMKDLPDEPDNKFVTREEWEVTAPTEPQKAALTGVSDAHPPAADNRFVTEQDLPADIIGQPEGSHVTREEWEQTAPTPDEKAALGGASEASAPNANNPYLTHQDLPSDIIGQSEGAFVTREEWTQTAPTSDEKAALNGFNAANTPSQDNPYATQADIISVTDGDYVTREEWAQTKPTTDEKAAMAGINKDYPPNTDNRYLTEKDIPADLIGLIELPVETFVNRKEWRKTAPTKSEKSALAGLGMHAPDEQNPYITKRDIGQLGYAARIVAAGTIDLSSEGSGQEMGGLEIVHSYIDWGMALLSFDGYRFDNRRNYVVKALPINPKVQEQHHKEFIVVQFVEFREDGFVLQMMQPFAQGSGRYALGPCMIEVTEAITSTDIRVDTSSDREETTESNFSEDIFQFWQDS